MIRQLVYRILLFVPFMMMVYVMLLLALGLLQPLHINDNLHYELGMQGHQYTRSAALKTVHDVDVLILGSSVAYRGFDTRIFEEQGYHCFNLGSNSQTPVQSLMLTKKYLSSINPKTVIYATHPTALASDGVESMLDLLANNENDRFTWEAVRRINHIKTYNTFLYSVIRQRTGIDKSYVEAVRKGEDTYIPGGYVQKDLHTYEYDSIVSPIMLAFYTKQVDALAEMVEYIRGHDIPLIIVYPPNTQAVYNRYAYSMNFDSLMTALGDYYNYNERLPLDDSLFFYDAIHMNQNGVERFDRQLLVDLALDSLLLPPK